MIYIYYILFEVGLAATIYYNALFHENAKLIASICFAILFIVSVFKTNPIKDKIFRSLIICYLLGCISNAYFYFIIGRTKLDILNIEILFPLMVAYSSYVLIEIKRDNLKLFLLPICIFSAWCAIQAVIHGLGSLRLLEYEDGDIAKNQIGVAFTVVAIICLVFAVEKDKNWYRIVYGILSLINLYPAYFLSCRTAQVCYIIVFIFVIYKRYRSSTILLIFVLSVLIILGVHLLGDAFLESFIGNREASDIDSLSSGRVSRLYQSWNYFLAHPLVGFLGSGDGYIFMPEAAHMFLLFRLERYGCFGAIPFIIIYIKLFNTMLHSVKDNNQLIAGTLLLAYVESLAEYAPPFGPGSSLILMFFLIGLYYHETSQHSTIKISQH